MIAPVATPEELTPEWLSAALGTRVDAVETSVVGTGQMGSCFRLGVTGDPSLPATVLAKQPTTDAGLRAMLHNSYAMEVLFYTDLAATVSVRTPETFYAGIGEKGIFTILMQDLAPAVPIDQIDGCSVEQARQAVVTLAGLHGPRWCDEKLIGTGALDLATAEAAQMTQDTLPGAADQSIAQLGDALDPADAETMRAAAAVIGPWLLGRSERFSLVHSDYRLDNLLFGPDGVYAVDWQGLTLGLPGRDLAYFLGTGLSVEERREHEHDLVTAYHEALGLPGYSFETCWDDYRFGLVQIPLIVGFGCAYGARSERGDRMFVAMLARGCAAIRDLDTFSLI